METSVLHTFCNSRFRVQIRKGELRMTILNTKGVEIMSVSEKKKILDEIAALPPQLRRRALDIVTGAKMGLEYAEKKEKEEEPKCRT